MLLSALTIGAFSTMTHREKAAKILEVRNLAGCKVNQSARAIASANLITAPIAEIFSIPLNFE